jgi:transposase
MNQPILSIDVAKGKSVAAAFLSYGEIYQKPFPFLHTPDGLASLILLLKHLEELSNLQPQVVLEATGNYSKPIASFFSANGYSVVVLNPLYTHQLKKKAIRKIKTDPIDAIRIAQAHYLGQGVPQFEMDEQVYELRALCRQYSHWKELYGEVQLHFRSVLDLLFPGYDRGFHKICNPTSLHLLVKYPTPQAILSANREDLIQILLQNRRGRQWNEEKLDVLISIARNSLPDSHATHAHKMALRNYITLLNCYQDGISNIEGQMLDLAETLPIYHLLRTIPGVGPITAATIFAEIGDIKRFPTSKQLTAFAGLDSSVYESGTFKSNQNRISKRGSSYLRTALYQATVCGISEQVHGPRNPILSRYYQQKRSEGKPAKLAIVATSNKLLRIIFGIWSRQVPFQAD